MPSAVDLSNCYGSKHPLTDWPVKFCPICTPTVQTLVVRVLGMLEVPSRQPLLAQLHTFNPVRLSTFPQWFSFTPKLNYSPRGSVLPTPIVENLSRVTRVESHGVRGIGSPPGERSAVSITAGPSRVALIHSILVEAIPTGQRGLCPVGYWLSVGDVIRREDIAAHAIITAAGFDIDSSTLEGVAVISFYLEAFLKIRS